MKKTEYLYPYQEFESNGYVGDVYHQIVSRIMAHDRAFETFVPNPIGQTDCCERCERTVPARLVNDDGICATCRTSEQENILEFV